MRILSDLALYRRLARQAVPMWPLVAALFLVGLLASPLALLAPLPLKIAVDTVLGSRPLPPLLASLLPPAMRSPSGVLGLVAVLAILIAVATQLQVAAQKYLTVLGASGCSSISARRSFSTCSGCLSRTTTRSAPPIPCTASNRTHRPSAPS